MVTKIIVACNLLISFIYLVGAFESYSRVTSRLMPDFAFGYLYPMLIWGLAVVVDVLLLMYLYRQSKLKITNRILITSVSFLPYLIIHLFGMYSVYRFFNAMQW
jgi:hypothetical protein